MLQIRIHNAEQAAVLACEGRIVLGQPTTALENAAQAVLAAHATSVLLDLSRVSAVDAAGLGTLVGIKQRVESAGAELRLLNPQRAVRHLLALTRLDEVLDIQSAEAAPVRLRRWDGLFRPFPPCRAV